MVSKRVISFLLSLVLLITFSFSPLFRIAVGADGETLINIGTYEAFGLHAVGTNVFYSFSPKYSGTYVFQTYRPFNGPFCDTVLQIYNSAGQLIASNNDYAEGIYSRIELALTIGSVYRIKILTYPDSLSYNCYLTVHKLGSMVLTQGDDDSIYDYVEITKNFKKKSDATNTYNCLAYAIGNINLVPNWPWFGRPDISQVASYLENLDISQIDSYTTSGRCIIAYGPSTQEITHFALSEYGVISAKMGGDECVYHSDIDPYYHYGNPVGFFLYNYDD